MSSSKFVEKVTFAIPIAALHISIRHSGRPPKIMYKDQIIGELDAVYFQMRQEDRSVSIVQRKPPEPEAFVIESRTVPAGIEILRPQRNKAVRLRVFLIECEIADVIPGINPWPDEDEVEAGD